MNTLVAMTTVDGISDANEDSAYPLPLIVLIPLSCFSFSLDRCDLLPSGTVSALHHLEPLHIYQLLARSQQERPLRQQEGIVSCDTRLGYR